MLSSTNLSLPKIQPQPISSSSPESPNSGDPQPQSPSETRTRKLKPSPKLNLWSRARSIRSGRKLNRPVQTGVEVTTQFNSVRTEDGSPDSEEVNGENNGVSDNTREEKAIYIISDGTGWTAEHSVNAALGQFDHCLVDRGCPVNTHLFSGIDDIDPLMEIVKQAARDGGMLVYTLADPSMAESAKRACELWGVPSTDILGPITIAIASHLGVSPSGLPRGARNSFLTEDYFQRIEAVEFTIKQDDGALPQNLHKADIVLTGVSRTGKTPLSIYLAQKGYKVANVPIVMGVDLPKTLFEIDPDKIFALTINPAVLQSIRKSRAKTLGLMESETTTYSEMNYVKCELEHAGKLFARNPSWPVIDVTSKAIEETAAIVLRLYNDRKQKHAMPIISKRY